MPTETEFQEAIDRVVRTNDPSPEELRAQARRLEQYADKWEAMEEI